ncbi:hypothetical protein AB0F09_02150 [Streptomyces olivaceus]|uniref:hypothetical protein n=1 Tax=Streptomyces olivaceus TaxID=47716 RepID=UPI0034036258
MTTSTAEADDWQPYVGDPVLTPAMTGGHRNTPDEEMHRLRSYLEAVVNDRRGGPVHTAVAFNAAYFGYELGGEGYGNGAFDIETFPRLTLNGEAPALPVGALTRIETGSDPLFAEIIYKEGCRPAPSDGGDVPAWTSGAPADAEGPGVRSSAASPVRRELLVPDFTVFGPGLQLPETKHKRFRDRQKWLNKDGHVVVGARYSCADDADLDDTAAFVRHLLTRQRESLLSALVPVSVVQLTGSGREERLEDALTGLLDTVAHALHAGDALRSWGHYALARTRIAAGLRHEGPLGEVDLCDLTGSLERSTAPTVRRRHGIPGPRTAYTAVGPWLRARNGAEGLLAGVEYAASVCRTNLAVTDFLRGDTDEGLRSGSGVRITLDDAFEYGGIWRSHHPGEEEADGSDPLLPAGRGWLDTLSPTEPAEAGAPDPGAEPAAEPDAAIAEQPLPVEQIGALEYLRVADSEISWQVPLRLAHVMDGRFPLNPRVAYGFQWLGAGSLPVRLELSHPGGTLEASEEVQQVTLELSGESGVLRGVEWPIDFIPGLHLRAQWHRGGTVFQLTTVELEEPVEVDGRLIGHRYDPQVLTREDAPGSGRDGDSGDGLDTRKLVLRAVRRLGRLTPDGHALLDRSVLPTGVYATAPAPRQITELEAAVAELIDRRSLYEAVGSRGADGQPHHPAREGETSIPLIGYTPNPVVRPRSATRGPGSVQPLGAEYFVHGFLRRLPPGSMPTDAQRAAYREHCRFVGKADGWELPHRYTFVTAHSRRR